ncbi:hypothetical protein PR048_012000 [Dryococelus australis]|uniref:Uncharacterized protein n=1 Tax=Dryococelus australis TaxID=614101 RepID=A0ABQ9HNE2_9NEOP|nr:hypothetical protein PR048_012000 [Dryococelus australis]
MPLVGGIFRGSPVPPAFSFRRCSISISLTLVGAQDLTVKGEHGAAPECKSGGTGDPRGDPPAGVIVRHGTVPSCENPCATLLGIEPGSPRWEASSLSTAPPRPVLSGETCLLPLGDHRTWSLNLRIFPIPSDRECEQWFSPSRKAREILLSRLVLKPVCRDQIFRTSSERYFRETCYLRLHASSYVGFFGITYPTIVVAARAKRETVPRKRHATNYENFHENGQQSDNSSIEPSVQAAMHGIAQEIFHRKVGGGMVHNRRMSNYGLVRNSSSAVERPADLLSPRMHAPACVSTMTMSEAKLSDTGTRVHQIRRRPNSMICMLDSTFLCIIEPQMCVHWLLPQCYPAFDNTEMCFLFPCKSAIGAESSRVCLINFDPIAKVQKFPLVELLKVILSTIADERRTGVTRNILDAAFFRAIRSNCNYRYDQQIVATPFANQLVTTHARQLAAQPIGNISQYAVANRTQGPFPDPRPANQEKGYTHHHDENTARLARRSDEALGVRVIVARIAPSLVALGRVTLRLHEVEEYPESRSLPGIQKMKELMFTMRWKMGEVKLRGEKWVALNIGYLRADEGEARSPRKLTIAHCPGRFPHTKFWDRLRQQSNPVRLGGRRVVISLHRYGPFEDEILQDLFFRERHRTVFANAEKPVALSRDLEMFYDEQVISTSIGSWLLCGRSSLLVALVWRTDQTDVSPVKYENAFSSRQQPVTTDSAVRCLYYSPTIKVNLVRFPEGPLPYFLRATMPLAVMGFLGDLISDAAPRSPCFTLTGSLNPDVEDTGYRLAAAKS